MRMKPSFFNTDMPEEMLSNCPECRERLNRRYAFYKKPFGVTAFVECWKYGIAGVFAVGFVLCLFLTDVVSHDGGGFGATVVACVITPFICIDLLSAALPTKLMVCCRSCDWEEPMKSLKESCERN